MTISQALILGIIQGITEFLPISSSGHLVLVPHILDWETQSLTFDAALHLGTLLALLLVFYKKWLHILRTKRYLTLVIIGTLPAAIIGFLFEGIIETYLRSLFVVSLTLTTVAGLMFISEKLSKKDRGDENLNIKDVLLIGVAQSLALIPGVSRSGITITAGLSRNLRRDAAAEFSFILGTPIILGAGIFKVLGLFQESITINEILTFGVGMITAAIVGVFTIKYLLRFLKTHTLLPFILYRIVLGVTILLFSL